MDSAIAPGCHATAADFKHLDSSSVLVENLAWVSEVSCEITGFSPQIDWIFPSSTSKRYLKG